MSGKNPSMKLQLIASVFFMWAFLLSQVTLSVDTQSLENKSRLKLIISHEKFSFSIIYIVTYFGWWNNNLIAFVEFYTKENEVTQ